MNPISASLVVAAFLFTATSAGATDTLTVLHKFVGGNDGNEPNWLIQASDGNFYGTTYLGVGTVFQVTPAGQFKTVFVLPPQNNNRFFYGDYFTSVVEGPDGFLYALARRRRGRCAAPLERDLYLYRESLTDLRVNGRGINLPNDDAILVTSGNWWRDVLRYSPARPALSFAL